MRDDLPRGQTSLSAAIAWYICLLSTRSRLWKGSVRVVPSICSAPLSRGREKNEEEFIRGLWRALNMEKQPFDLGPACKLINENCTEAGDFLADKCLGLWDLQKTVCETGM